MLNMTILSESYGWLLLRVLYETIFDFRNCGLSTKHVVAHASPFSLFSLVCKHWKLSIPVRWLAFPYMFFLDNVKNFKYVCFSLGVRMMYYGNL